MVATDVAARGLDISGVKNIVNFDCATSIDGHVHRVGRTARGENEGAALTLVTTRHDRDFAAHLCLNLEQSNQLVPLELRELAKTSPHWARLARQNSKATLSSNEASFRGTAIASPPSLYAGSAPVVAGGAAYVPTAAAGNSLSASSAASSVPVAAVGVVLTSSSIHGSNAANPTNAAGAGAKRSRWDR